MNILTLSNCPLVESQGSGYVILNYARGLRVLGHRVDLIGPEKLEFWPFLKKAKSHRIAVGMLCYALWLLLWKSYDIVEFYGAEAWLAVSLLNRWPGRKFLLVLHSNGIETYCHERLEKHLSNVSLSDGQPRKWYQNLFSPPIARAFTEVDGIVTVSHADRRYAVEQRYQRPDKIAAFENPLLEIYRQQAVTFERSPVIGFCGSWLLSKGIQIIQADIPRILKEFPECRFKLIGVGRDFRLENAFESAVCSQIEVLPFIESKEELRRVYQSLKILIVPSFFESFGLVTAEAMACGCAVVASRTGFAADLIHGEEVLLLEQPVSPCLYAAVRQLLLDEPLRQKIAQGGYQRAQSLTWPNALNGLEATYQTWLNDFRQLRRSGACL